MGEETTGEEVTKSGASFADATGLTSILDERRIGDGELIGPRS